MRKIITDKLALSKLQSPWEVGDWTTTGAGQNEFISKQMHLFLLQNKQISEGAIGLACNQLGLQGRVVLVRTGNKKTWETFVNPEILSYGEETIIHEEGCLSVPKKSIKVERHTQITIRYSRGKDKIIREMHGQEAIVMQHEIDHLNGILITDKEQNAK